MRSGGTSPPMVTSVDGVSPAVMSTILLTTMIFTVYLLVSVCKTMVELSGRTALITKLEGTLALAQYTVNFCSPKRDVHDTSPKRDVHDTFRGSSGRGCVPLQIDPKYCSSQRWA